MRKAIRLALVSAATAALVAVPAAVANAAPTVALKRIECAYVSTTVEARITLKACATTLVGTAAPSSAETTDVSVDVRTGRGTGTARATLPGRDVVYSPVDDTTTVGFTVPLDQGGTMSVEAFIGSAGVPVLMPNATEFSSTDLAASVWVKDNRPRGTVTGDMRSDVTGDAAIDNSAFVEVDICYVAAVSTGALPADPCRVT